MGENCSVNEGGQAGESGEGLGCVAEGWRGRGWPRVAVGEVGGEEGIGEKGWEGVGERGEECGGGEKDRVGEANAACGDGEMELEGGGSAGGEERSESAEMAVAWAKAVTMFRRRR